MVIEVLRTDSAAEESLCEYRISVVGHDERVVSSASTAQPCTLCRGSSKGWDQWEARSPSKYDDNDALAASYRKRLKAFQDDGFIADDVLTIEVSMKLFLGQPGRLRSPGAPDGAEELLADLGRLLDDGLAADVAVVARDGSQRPAHRALLSLRSPVFRAMFEHSEMRESQSGRVTLGEVEPSTLGHFLRFLYCGQLPEALQDQEIWAVIAVAHRYEVQGLVVECARRLQARLTPENAAAVLCESEKLRIGCLKKAALDFMIRDSGTLGEVQASDAYHALPAELLKEILAHVTGTRKRGREGGYEFPSATEWPTLTISKLKLALAERGLPTSGNKADLVSRLQACRPAGDAQVWQVD